MYFLRAILASLLSLTCTLAVSAFVILTTLQTTVLNRQEVKSWAQNSGIYGKMIDTTVSNNQTVQQQLSAVSSVVSQDELKTALDKTFLPNYVQGKTEKVIDSAYDWLEGKQSQVTINIDTTQQKDAFVTNLANELQPKIATLPRCTSLNQFDANNPTCLPATASANLIAQSIATDAGNELSIFQQPITNDTLAKANSEATPSDAKADTMLPASNADIQQLPAITANLRQWLFWLPIIAILAGGLSILLSRYHLKAAKHVAARLTLGLSFTCIVGLLIAIFGKNISLSSIGGGGNSAIKSIVDPLLHQALPVVGSRLAWVSGISAAITLVLWIVFQTLWENKEKAKLTAPPEDDHPVAPINVGDKDQTMQDKPTPPKEAVPIAYHDKTPTKE